MRLWLSLHNATGLATHLDCYFTQALQSRLVSDRPRDDGGRTDECVQYPRAAGFAWFLGKFGSELCLP